MMKDNGDGTYTADYTVPTPGFVTVSVELLNKGLNFPEIVQSKEIKVKSLKPSVPNTSTVFSRNLNGVADSLYGF